MNVAAHELKRKINELQATPLRWWAGEAEVGRVYFSKKRTKEDDVRWLTLQAARELATAQRLLEDVPTVFHQIDVSIDRHDFEGLLRAAYEEIRHYRLLADIVESLTRTKLNPAKILPYSGCQKIPQGHPELPAMTEEIETTKRLHKEYKEVAQVALSFFEGAGGAIFHSGSKILDYPFTTYSDGEVEKQIASAMKTILDDEIGHGPVYIAEAAEKLKSEQEFELAKKILERKAKAHLRLRNETFGYPLSEQRMREIDDGINIERLTLDFHSLRANPQ